MLSSLIFSENPTHNTFKWKMHYEFTHSKDKRFFQFVILFKENIFWKKYKC